MALAIGALNWLTLGGAGGALAASPFTKPGETPRRLTNVSANWAGYAVTGKRSTQGFTRVAAVWTQPAASCRTARAGYSAFWIGLGGFHRGTGKLEQIGTEADCTARGTAVNYAWYELVPADPVNLRLRVGAGDTIGAQVSVADARVSLTIADLTSGRAVSRTLHMAVPDTSSAEWIAEAPSACGVTACRVLPLANFGAVAFRNATVSSSGQTGTIAQSAWTTTRVELRDDSLGVTGGQFGVRQLLADALPSGLLDSGRSFTVNWRSAAAFVPSQLPGSAGPPA